MLKARDQVVVVGAGQAGYSVVTSLRTNGFDGRIVLVGNEGEPPYQRPPLSKAFLSGEPAAPSLHFQPAAEFAAMDIDLIAGDAAVEIDRQANRIVLASGVELTYAHLVLATGTRNRRLFDPAIAGIFSLRSLADAEAIKAAFAETDAVVILGGGFLGLEIAVAAQARGLRVHVLEAEALPLSRNVSPVISAHILASHRARGIEISLGVRLRDLRTSNNRLEAVELDDGRVLACHTLVTSVGVVPNDEIAVAAGLAVTNGIVVNERLETSDARISAIGDCARFPHWMSGQMVRLESVQNAVDQGEWLGARLCGDDCLTYAAVPWFWSDQGGIRLQIAGLRAGADRFVIRGGATENSFSAFCFKGDRLACIESVNMPGHHMKGRRFLAVGARAPTPEEVEAGAF